MTIDSLARSLARAVPATKPALRAGYAASERMKSSLASRLRKSD